MKMKWKNENEKILKNGLSKFQNRNIPKTLNICQKLSSISDSVGQCMIKAFSTTEMSETWNTTNSTNDIP